MAQEDWIEEEVCIQGRTASLEVCVQGRKASLACDGIPVTFKWSALFEFTVPPKYPEDVLEAKLQQFPNIDRCALLVEDIYKGKPVTKDNDIELLERFHEEFDVPVLESSHWLPCYNGLKPLLENSCKRVPPLYRQKSLAKEIAEVGDCDLLRLLYDSDLPFDVVSNGFKDTETMRTLRNLKKLANDFLTLEHVMHMDWVDGLQLMHESGADLEKLFAQMKYASQYVDFGMKRNLKEHSKFDELVGNPGDLVNGFAEKGNAKAVEWCCKAGLRATPTAHVKAAVSNSIDTVKVLLSHGVAPDQDAMSAAADRGHITMIRQFRDAGLRITPNDTLGIVRASRWSLDHHGIEEILDMCPVFDESSLVSAIRHGCDATVESLLKRGVVPTELSIKAAVRNNSAKLLLLLLEYRAPIDWDSLASDEHEMMLMGRDVETLVKVFTDKPRILGRRKRDEMEAKVEGEVSPDTMDCQQLVDAYALTGRSPDLSNLPLA